VSDPLEPDDERVLLNWATAHFGDDCDPGITYPDDGRVVISVTNPENRNRYHMTVIARGDQLYVGGGKVTVDSKESRK
jgi:hypothetical protein